MFIGLKEVLSIMINEYDKNLSIDTLRYYILPSMFKNGLSGSQIINELQLLGISSGTSTHSIVLYLLSQNNIQEAANIGNYLLCIYI